MPGTGRGVDVTEVESRHQETHQDPGQEATLKSPGHIQGQVLKEGHAACPLLSEPHKAVGGPETLFFGVTHVLTCGCALDRVAARGCPSRQGQAEA